MSHAGPRREAIKRTVFMAISGERGHARTLQRRASGVRRQAEIGGRSRGVSWRVSSQRGASARSRPRGGCTGMITSASIGKLAMARNAQSLLAHESISSQGALGGASSSQQSPVPWSQGILASVLATAGVVASPDFAGRTATTDCTSKSIANNAIPKDGQRRRRRRVKCSLSMNGSTWDGRSSSSA